MSNSLFVSDMLFNVFQQGAMPRMGSLFVDLNTSDRVHNRAEILQLAATKLSGNPPYYNDYAVPFGRINPNAIRYHGITNYRGDLYHEGQNIDNPCDNEETLLHDFVSWINRRYDEVFIIHHSPWKRSAIEYKLEDYNLHINPQVHYVDIMQIMSDHQHDLGLRNVSLDWIFWVLDGNRRYRDALNNTLAMRRCAINAAHNLQMTVENFLHIFY